MTTLRNRKMATVAILIATAAALAMAAGYLGVPRPVFYALLIIVLAVAMWRRMLSSTSDSTKKN
jgi:4-hydroxybenzoate polyprenyltransferase